MLELKLVQEPLRLHLCLGRSILKVCKISLQYSSWLSFESLQIHFPFFSVTLLTGLGFPNLRKENFLGGGGGGVGGARGKMGKGRGEMGSGTTGGLLPILGKSESWSRELELAEEGLDIF